MIAPDIAAEEPCDVGAVLHRGQVVAGPLRARGLEPVGVSHRPGGHVPAIGTTEDAQAGRVDPVEMLAGRIDAGHDVLEVDTAPSGSRVAFTFRPPDRPAPLLAVPGAAAGVAVQDAKAGGSLELELIHEPVAVLGERSAVNVQQRRVLLAWPRTTRSNRPALDLAAVGRAGDKPLRRAEADRIRKLLCQ